MVRTIIVLNVAKFGNGGNYIPEILKSNIEVTVGISNWDIEVVLDIYTTKKVLGSTKFSIGWRTRLEILNFDIDITVGVRYGCNFEKY